MSRLLFSTLLLASSAACAAASDKYPPGVQTRAQFEEAIGGSYYAEESKDGRIYVIGREATHAGFKRTSQMQFTKTFIGAGPEGATLVFEVNDKAPQLCERLTAEYAKRNNVPLQ